MTFEPGRSDDRPDVLITLDDLAAAETAIRRLERVVATRRRRLRRPRGRQPPGRQPRGWEQEP